MRKLQNSVNPEMKKVMDWLTANKLSLRDDVNNIW